MEKTDDLRNLEMQKSRTDQDHLNPVIKQANVLYLPYLYKDLDGQFLSD